MCVYVCTVYCFVILGQTICFKKELSSLKQLTGIQRWGCFCVCGQVHITESIRCSLMSSFCLKTKLMITEKWKKIKCLVLFTIVFITYLRVIMKLFWNSIFCGSLFQFSLFDLKQIGCTLAGPRRLAYKALCMIWQWCMSSWYLRHMLVYTATFVSRLYETHSHICPKTSQLSCDRHIDCLFIIKSAVHIPTLFSVLLPKPLLLVALKW